MSTDIAIRPGEPLGREIELAVLHGDLAQLNADQRMQYHRARCRAAGFNELARPFAYIKVRGEKGAPDRLVLYCLREGAEQLNQMHRITHSITNISCDDKKGVIEVMCQATSGDGRSTFDLGVASIDGLRGSDLANAKMKAITKAKRRATLSLCGLGDMMDETELDTVSTVKCTENGTPVPADNGTGHGSGKYCADEEARACVEAETRYWEARESAWADRWTDKQTGEVPAGVEPLCRRIFQIDNHCAKWAAKAGLLKPETLDETGQRPSQLGKLTGIIYKNTPNKLKNELKHYFDELERVALQAMREKHPELFREPGSDDDQADDDGPHGKEYRIPQP